MKLVHLMYTRCSFLVSIWMSLDMFVSPCISISTLGFLCTKMPTDGRMHGWTDMKMDIPIEMQGRNKREEKEEIQENF